jgi:anti-anti-sigma factor
MLYTIIKNIFERSKDFLLSLILANMEVKTDTKEKFHVIRVESPQISANMAAELSRQLLELLKGTIKNVVLNLSSVKSLDEEAAEILVRTQQKFYETNASFVVCELPAEIESFLDEKELLELMNVTPTESEASDIVQMEEIERELLGGDDFDD